VGKRNAQHIITGLAPPPTPRSPARLFFVLGQAYLYAAMGKRGARAGVVSHVCTLLSPALFPRQGGCTIATIW
jgi:hypothetical protein